MNEPVPVFTDSQLEAISQGLIGLLEIADAGGREFALNAINPAVLATALLFTETDPEYAARWAAATDAIEKATVLHEIVAFLVTPEAVPA